jgi:hypothetical protein
MMILDIDLQLQGNEDFDQKNQMRKDQNVKCFQKVLNVFNQKIIHFNEENLKILAQSQLFDHELYLESIKIF